MFSLQMKRAGCSSFIFRNPVDSPKADAAVRQSERNHSEVLTGVLRGVIS